MNPFPLLLGVLTVAGAGCASSRAPGGADDDPVDAAPRDSATPDSNVPDDGRSPDAALPTDAALTAAGPTLLLSEVVLAPAGGELVEIVNPTGVAVDLSTYYLSDAPDYWKLPAGVPTVDSTDAIVRFRAGASIPAGGVVTVAFDTAASFTTTYGTAPTYSIASGTVVLVTSALAPTLTNAGEPIVLFRWDGMSDRVTDVDLMLAGTPSAGNLLVDKSGVAQDGPDSGTTTSAYASDARTIASQATVPASGQSTKRIALESSTVELQAGGNGVGGQDETSEATARTWDATFTAPTPGTVPAALAP